ncbi:MAG: hypothetical protein IID32_02795, partial [Planctomycetes bacterium]|nr:hypothetical protein [Planctomycetota bacterium]
PLSIDPSRSKAYCLIPGRIFVNLQGREPGGIVPLDQYQNTRKELAADLLELKDPDTNESVIDRVFMREELYWSDQGQSRDTLTPEEVARSEGTFGKASDLVAIPKDGYDLKLGLNSEKIFVRSEMEGMHTYHDAFLVARGVDLPADNLEILMLTRPILQKLNVKPPEDMDGIDQAVTPLFDQLTTK